ncbi:MAG: tetratricopeptide repeat protein [Bacteroidota bacterium]
MIKNISIVLFFALCFFSPLFWKMGEAFAQQDALFESGKSKQRAGKHQAAIIDFSGSIKKNEYIIQKYFKKYNAYQKMSDFEKANKNTEKPFIDKKYAKPYCYRGISYSALRKNTEAMEDLNKALKIDSVYAQALYERGKLKWISENKKEGCIDLGLASILSDSNAREMISDNFCWLEAVKIYDDAITNFKLNQYQQAMADVEKAITICPDSVRYLILRGKCYYIFKKFGLAIQDFNKAIKLSPRSNEDVYFNRGITYFELKKYQQAFDDLSKAIEFNADYSDAYLFRAYSREKLEKPKEALYDYDHVIRLKPDEGLAYFKRGLLKQELNEKKSACRDFKKAEELEYPEAADYVERCK